MIIKSEGNEYIVIDICFWQSRNSEWPIKMLCWHIEGCYLDYIYFSESEIIDGRFTPNMSIHKHNDYDSSNVVAILEHDTLHSELSWFWEALDDDDPKAMLLFHKVINEMKEFHGLPTDDLSELEEEVRREEMVQKPITEKERRTNAIETELEEYLRLGEER